MAYIRITSELLEHLLDLPDGVAIVDVHSFKRVEDIPVVVLEVAGEGGGINGWDDTEYALQYQETESGTSLVSAIPVPG